MKTILLQVGKTTDKHFLAGINDYAERISHYMPMETVTIAETKNTKSLTVEQQKTIEGEQILKQVRPTDTTSTAVSLRAFSLRRGSKGNATRPSVSFWP